MKTYNKKFSILAGLFAFGLCGCSGEPSSGDIEEAFRAKIEQTNQQVKQFSGSQVAEGLLTTLNEVKKLGCAEAQGAAGYNCDVDIDVTAPFVGRTKNTSKLRLIKGSDGWQIVE